MKEISEKNEISNNSIKFLHPKSRKRMILIKKLNKKSKKVKTKQESRFKQTLIVEKLLWIKEHMDPNICPYTVELTSLLIEKYIARNDDEIEQIKIKRSIGDKRNQQHVSRENAIRLTKEREIEDYENHGIEIPNILNPVQCNMLKTWNGDLKFLPNFKFCYFNKNRLNKKMFKQRITKDEINSKNSKNSKNKLDILENLKSNEEIIVKENQDKMDVV